MGRPLSVAVIFLFCLATGARAGPWRPDNASYSAGGNRAASENKAPGSAADYLKAFDQTIIIPGIGASVRDGWAELIDGHIVSGAEVIHVQAQGPAASAGIRAARLTVFARISSLLQAADSSFRLDGSDVIFAADGERIRSTLDLVDRIQGLATGECVYLTIARQGQRVQIHLMAGDASRSQ